MDKCLQALYHTFVRFDGNYFLQLCLKAQVKFVLGQFQKVSMGKQLPIVFAIDTVRQACTTISSHYLTITPDGITVAHLVLQEKEKSMSKGSELVLLRQCSCSQRVLPCCQLCEENNELPEADCGRYKVGTIVTLSSTHIFVLGRKITATVLHTFFPHTHGPLPVAQFLHHAASLSGQLSFKNQFTKYLTVSSSICH